MNKKVFKTKVKHVDDPTVEVEVELAVIKASPKQQVEAQLVFSKAWRQAEEAGNILRRDIDEIARKRNLWNDDKKTQVEEMEKKIISLEKKLRGGANSFSSLEEAKTAAFDIRKLRFERSSLLRPRIELDNVTCENFADLARTNYLISQTVVYNEGGRPYFAGLDDFISKSNDKVALDSAIAYYELSVDEQREENYEDTFLKKYKFTDDKGRLINKDGHLITDDGKLINDQYQYVNEKEELVNINGDLVDEKGNPLITFREWDEPVGD